MTTPTDTLDIPQAAELLGIDAGALLDEIRQEAIRLETPTARD